MECQLLPLEEWKPEIETKLRSVVNQRNRVGGIGFVETRYVEESLRDLAILVEEKTRWLTFRFYFSQLDSYTGRQTATVRFLQKGKIPISDDNQLLLEEMKLCQHV